jgi:hypothetical protein
MLETSFNPSTPGTPSFDNAMGPSTPSSVAAATTNSLSAGSDSDAGNSGGDSIENEDLDDVNNLETNILADLSFDTGMDVDGDAGELGTQVNGSESDTADIQTLDDHPIHADETTHPDHDAKVKVKAVAAVSHPRLSFKLKVCP